MTQLKYDANIAPPPAGWLELDEADRQWLVRQYHASARCTHPPAQNPILHAAVHVIVENQVAIGDDTPARSTLERLMREGLSRHDALHAIGSVLAAHVYGLLNASHPEARPGTEQCFEAIRHLTADTWSRSAIEDSTENHPEWLADGHEVEDWSAATPDEIISALCVPPPHFPRAALRAAEHRKEQLADRFLDLVRNAHRAAMEGASPPDNGHIFAMMLLAELEDPRAFDVIAELFSLPEELCDDIAGDFVTEDLGRILASVCGGRIELLARIIQDRARWEFVRSAALTALCALVQRGQVTREAAVAYLVTLTRETFADEAAPIWNDVAHTVLDLHAAELFPDVRRMIREGLIEPFCITESAVDRAERGGLGAAKARLDHNPHLQPVRDVVAEVEWWHGYCDPWEEDPCDEPADNDVAPAAPLPVRVVKIGRNDPCPCGSGRKYKKCCIDKHS